MYVIYSLRECHYLKRTKLKKNRIRFRIVLIGADHHYALNVCPEGNSFVFPRVLCFARRIPGMIRTRRIEDRNKDVLPSFVIAI